ncbi:hypothetical protein ACVCH0_20760 [Burkholderia glumae]|nr:hypothetical protein [Burkholderia glumae]MCM2544255.1 hypothetical protein [Burkholderia glumae]
MGRDSPTIPIGTAVVAAAVLILCWCLRRFRAAQQPLKRHERVYHD